MATLTITGNKAEYGGGVGSNGGIEIGHDGETTEVKVKKVWASGSPQPITVELLKDGYVIDKVVLSEDNNWEFTFTNLPIGGNYSVREPSVPGFVTTVTGDAETGFIITNRKEWHPQPHSHPETHTYSNTYTHPHSLRIPFSHTGTHANTFGFSHTYPWRKSYSWPFCLPHSPALTVHLVPRPSPRNLIRLTMTSPICPKQDSCGGPSHP